MILGHCELEIGTVGWVDDGGVAYDPGTTDNDGANLVRVTLFRGRDPSLPLDHTQAQGQQILAKLSSNFTVIPPRGTRVLVAVPGTFGRVPGAAMIVCFDNPNPGLVGARAAGELVVAPATGRAMLLLDQGGNATLSTQTGNDPSGQPVAVAVKSGDEVDVVATNVKLGRNPTDGVVLQTLLQSQLSALQVLLNDIINLLTPMAADLATPPYSDAALAPLMTAVVAAQTAFSTALGTPNYSQTVKAAQ